MKELNLLLKSSRINAGVAILLLKLDSNLGIPGINQTIPGFQCVELLIKEKGLWISVFENTLKIIESVPREDVYILFIPFCFF